MIKVVSWNIGRRIGPWHELIRMAECGDADLALLQEAGSPPDGLKSSIEFDGRVFWDHALYDRLPLIVRLSDRVTIQPYRQVAPKMELAADEIGTSDIGTIAAARVTPIESEQEAFIAVSMYASWLTPHPSASSARHPKRYSDASAHRIISDLATFIGGRRDPSKHRVLAAGDLNMCYGATGRSFSLPERERTVWDRMQALGLEFLGPQIPNGRPAGSVPPDVPADTKNVPTHYLPGESAAGARIQLDYAFASSGFHECLQVVAMNGVDEWGSSDHCRVMITMRTKADHACTDELPQ